MPIPQAQVPIPKAGDDGDKQLSSYIRRANLDAFWARATRTVAQNLSMIKEGVREGKNLGIAMYEGLGPWPTTYDHVMPTAIHVLVKSQQMLVPCATGSEAKEKSAGEVVRLGQRLS